MAAKIVEKEVFVQAFENASQSGAAMVDKIKRVIRFEGSPWEFEFRAKAGYVIHNMDGQRRVARMICPDLSFDEFVAKVPKAKKVKAADISPDGETSTTETPAEVGDISPNGETSDEAVDDISPDGETSGDGKNKGGSSSKRK